MNYWIWDQDKLVWDIRKIGKRNSYKYRRKISRKKKPMNKMRGKFLMYKKK